MSSVLLQRLKDKVLNFTGPVVAAVTPFKNDGSIDGSAVLPYAKYLVSIGVKGFYVHGTTGEGVSLSVDEKKVLTEAWASAIETIAPGGQSDLLLVINVSATCIKEVQEMASLCQGLHNVDMIATLPPFYYRPSTVDALVKYMGHIGEAAPAVPLLYYHFPKMTGVELPLNDFLSAGTMSVPSLMAVKYTSVDINELNYIHNNFKGRIHVFPGYEESLMAAFSLGMKSSICAQFNFSEDVKTFYDISANVHSNPDTARQAQVKLSNNNRKYQNGNFIANLKAQLSKRVDFSVGLPRPPVV